MINRCALFIDAQTWRSPLDILKHKTKRLSNETEVGPYVSHFIFLVDSEGKTLLELKSFPRRDQVGLWVLEALPDAVTNKQLVTYLQEAYDFTRSDITMLPVYVYALKRNEYHDLSCSFEDVNDNVKRLCLDIHFNNTT